MELTNELRRSINEVILKKYKVFLYCQGYQHVFSPKMSIEVMRSVAKEVREILFNKGFCCHFEIHDGFIHLTRISRHEEQWKSINSFLLLVEKTTRERMSISYDEKKVSLSSKNYDILIRQYSEYPIFMLHMNGDDSNFIDLSGYFMAYPYGNGSYIFDRKKNNLPSVTEYFMDLYNSFLGVFHKYKSFGFAVAE